MRILASLLVALVILCHAAPAQTLDSRHSGRRTGDFDGKTLALINAYRADKGLTKLLPSGALHTIAREHSRYQANRNNLSHDGFRQRMGKAKAAGLSPRCTENAGYNYRSPQHLFAGWRQSSGHNQNLLRPHLRYAGVSVVGRYSTFFACG